MSAKCVLRPVGARSKAIEMAPVARVLRRRTGRFPRPDSAVCVPGTAADEPGGAAMPLPGPPLLAPRGPVAP